LLQFLLQLSLSFLKSEDSCTGRVSRLKQTVRWGSPRCSNWRDTEK